MKKGRLIRSSDDGKETLGDFFIYDENDSLLLQCKTLERPWLLNQHGVSCIPLGRYDVQWSHMQIVNKDHYQVLNVVNRDAIFIHGGNTFADSHGCILLGYDFKDINCNGEPDITNSGNAIKTFENIMNKEPFTLMIVSE